MKSLKKTFALSILVSILLSGCVMVDSSINGDDDNYTNKIYGSGNVITITKGYTDFNSVEFQSGFKVKLVKASEYKITIEIDDNIINYLNTYQSGKKIFIGLADGNSYKNVTINATIETPDLQNIIADGGVIVEFAGNTVYKNFLAELNGGSVVKGNLEAESLDLKLNGGSIVDLSGSAKDLKINGNGGAIIKLSNFHAETCNLYFNGGCIANVYVTGTLNVSLSGGSILKYKGNPTFGTISITGGSIIQRED